MKKKQLITSLIAAGMVSLDMFPRFKRKKSYGKDLKNWKKPRAQRIAEAKARKANEK